MTANFSLHTYVGTCRVPHNYESRSAPLKASAHFAGPTERKGNESNWIFNCWNLLNERVRKKSNWARPLVVSRVQAWWCGIQKMLQNILRTFRW